VTAPYRCEHVLRCPCAPAAESAHSQLCDALNERNRLRARAAALEAERDRARIAADEYRTRLDVTARTLAEVQTSFDRQWRDRWEAARALARRRGEALRGLMEEWSRRARALDTWRCTSNEAASEALRACVLDVERALSDERESSGESEGGGEP
jgi:hypothetical protein